MKPYTTCPDCNSEDLRITTIHESSRDLQGNQIQEDAREFLDCPDCGFDSSKTDFQGPDAEREALTIRGWVL